MSMWLFIIINIIEPIELFHRKLWIVNCECNRIE